MITTHLTQARLPQSENLPASLPNFTPPPNHHWDLKAVAFINDFTHQLTEPTMFPAFLAGGMTFRMLRWGAAGQWVASPAVKSLSGLFGRQLGASTFALGGEVAAFTGAQHAARGLFDLPAPHQTTLGKEMAGTAIMLSSLRSFGFGAGLLGGMLQRSGLAGPGTTSLLSLAGSYTGLLAAQRAEHHWLHPEIPETGNPYLNAAVSLIHFTGFGMMARNITPRSWQTMEAHLEQKTQTLIRQKALEIREGIPLGLDAKDLIWQTTGAPFPSRRPPRPPLPIPSPINYSKPDSQPNLVEFSAKLTPEQRALVINLFQKLTVGSKRFSETLAQSSLIGTERFDLALRRINHVAKATSMEEPKSKSANGAAAKTEDSKNGSAKSSYINWITRWGFERIVKKEDVENLDRMITLITEATPRPEFETFLSPYFPEGRLPPPPPPSKRKLWDLLKFKNPTLKAIDTLPLGATAKTTLHRWAAAQKGRDASTPFFIPEKDFLHRLEYLKKMKDLPKWAIAEAVLERAATSPLGLIKIHRLHQILHSEMEYDSGLKGYTARGFLGTKLRELVDDKFRFAPEIPEAPHERSNFRYGAPGGHLGDHGPEDLLRPMLTQLPDLLDPVKEQTRSARRRKVLAQFLDKHREDQAYTQENLAEAFQQLHQYFGKENYPIEIDGEKGDFSLHIARQLADKSIMVEALPDEAYQARFHEIKKALAEKKGKSYQKKSVDHAAYFFNFWDTKVLPGIEKPIILVKITGKNSRTLKPEADLFFDDLKALLHEWMHVVESRRFSQGVRRPWTEGVQLKQEAATHTTVDWFGAQHGDAKELRDLTTEGLGGYMMRFLDHYESAYKKFWRE